MKKIILLSVPALALLLAASFNRPSTANYFSNPGKTMLLRDYDTVDSLLEVKVSDLKQYDGDQYVVELEPKNGKSDYILPLVIGTCEITAMYDQINDKSSPRPMTYDLVTNIFKSADLKIKKVTVTELKNSTYYAVISINNNGKMLEIDSRPSDAINLALRAKAPIFVAKKVFDEAKEKKASH